jgi:Tfp pilus assembly protein FimV
MAALWGGESADKLIEGYELDVARINRIIQKIRDGSVLEMAPRDQENPLTGQPIVDPMTGEPSMVPGWMPDEQDDPVVWQAILSDWMKTEEYEQLGPEFQEIARHMLQGMRQLEAQKQMEAAAAQQAQAEQLGMDNASKPARTAPNPSMRKPEPGSGSG